MSVATNAGALQGTYWITTWGCQMNELDSERTAGLLRAQGYERAAALEVADVVLYMTCSVRDKAEQKVYHSLASLTGLKRRNPDLVVGVLGCVAEQEGEAILKGSPVADLVVGPRQLERLPALVARVRGERVREVATGFDELAYEPATVAREAGVRARITVMEGCDFRCTFCVVPNTRGPEACRAPDAIVEEARRAVGEGFRELLLLGQTVNAYRHGGTRFADLLVRLDRESGAARIKFVSSHPLHFTPELMEALAGCPSLVPWVNVPAQSGSDRVLKRMKRLYGREELLARVAALRARVPGIALNTDLIVGFPGEDDEDFRQTMRLVEQAEFDSAYTFKYSPRPRTPALRLPDDVPGEVKTRRLQELSALQASIQRRTNLRFVGTVQEVLVDEVEEGVVRGRTPCQRIVSFPGGPGRMGELARVRIDASGVHGLAGVALPPPAATASV